MIGELPYIQIISWAIANKHNIYVNIFFIKPEVHTDAYFYHIIIIITYDGLIKIWMMDVTLFNL